MTGVFVSIGLVIGQVGEWIGLALLFAGILAACNGLSSAQLAAAFPVSGGTYEYAYRTLHPLVGIFAGWLFLTAKSASAAYSAVGKQNFRGTMRYRPQPGIAYSCTLTYSCTAG